PRRTFAAATIRKPQPVSSSSSVESQPTPPPLVAAPRSSHPHPSCVVRESPPPSLAGKNRFRGC
uniref:Uncharacterized protein n=2 Tax=Cucumis melo TaxID=3656 RepID=A0A9I9E3J4_CUCME